MSDYLDKANSFFSWITTIIISNLVYLISFENGIKLQLILDQKEEWWWRSFWLTVVALAGIFFFKVFGVVAAWLRVKKKDDKCLEFIRAWICFPIVLLTGMLAIAFTLVIVVLQFTSI